MEKYPSPFFRKKNKKREEKQKQNRIFILFIYLHTHTYICMYVMYIYVYVYVHRRTPTLCEELATRSELENLYDKHAVKILKNNDVVSHETRDTSKCYTR